MIRAVIDPSVLVSAFIGSPEAGPGQLVAAWRDNRFTLIASPLLIEELGEVLARPKFARWSGGRRGVAYVAAFSARCEHQPDPPDAGPSVRDPKDEYLVALAVASGADALVSVDRDLLETFVENLLILNPAAFLGHLTATTS